MGRITESLIRKRAEHNEGMLSTLEEVALHQQNIEKIEVLGHLCPKLKILYLQNNLIGKIQNLHKLKDLEYINLAVNNVTKVQNLQRCESLKKLDLTINFISKAGLLTVESLQSNIHLQELYLLGNPCSDWPGYRQYVIAKLPKLQRLDGKDIKHSERILAAQELPVLETQLRQELREGGIDPDTAAQVEDDSLYEEGAEIPETGYVDESGELRRPWCPATRILDHREMEAKNREADDKKRAGQQDSNDPSSTSSSLKPPRHESFPPLPKDGERFFQKNEGKWDFSLRESDDGASVLLDVDVGKYLDSSLIQTDLQPKYVRLLIKGRLLALELPCEVKTDAAIAQRSKITGNLLITMPKADGSVTVPVDPLVIKQQQQQGGAAGLGAKAKTTPATSNTKKTSIFASASSNLIMSELRKATVQAVAAEALDDDDYVPDL